MLRLASLSLALTLAVGLAFSASVAKDYFTEDELDLIRDAQELQLRVPVYFKLAERRLITLGLMEKSDKEKEKERKEQEKYEKDKKKAGEKAATTLKAPVDDLAYLKDFTRPELLRGYIQAIEEVMSNIDDSYTRRLDVRGALESLEKFTRETLPVVEKFQAKNAAEKSALDDAISKAKEANAGAKDAMKTVPKTEKKPPL